MTDTPDLSALLAVADAADREPPLDTDGTLRWINDNHTFRDTFNPVTVRDLIVRLQAVIQQADIWQDKAEIADHERQDWKRWCEEAGVKRADMEAERDALRARLEDAENERDCLRSERDRAEKSIDGFRLAAIQASDQRDRLNARLADVEAERDGLRDGLKGLDAHLVRKQSGWQAGPAMVECAAIRGTIYALLFPDAESPAKSLLRPDENGDGDD